MVYSFTKLVIWHFWSNFVSIFSLIFDLADHLFHCSQIFLTPLVKCPPVKYPLIPLNMLNCLLILLKYHQFPLNPHYINIYYVRNTSPLTSQRWLKMPSCTSISRLGCQVMVRCNVATSIETGKLVLQLMFFLNLLFQNTWLYINWWLYIPWHPRIDCSHLLLIVMHEFGCFELVYVRLMKSQSHETRSFMKLTGGGQFIWSKYKKWITLGQHSCPMVQTRYLKESKTTAF